MDEYYFIVSFVLFTVLGVCVGSFLNVLIYRLPRGLNIAHPSSHCPKCGNKLKWYHNIPLFSYIFLGGKCGFCKEKISVRYFLVELANGVFWFLSAFLFYKTKGVLFSAVMALSFSVLLTIAFCDLDTMIIPDTLQLTLLVLGIVGIFADKTTPYYDKLFGLLLGGGFFLFFYLISFVIFKREGLGFGDVKLMACSGLLMGWKATIIAIIFAVFSALIFILARKIFKTTHKDPYVSEITGTTFDEEQQEKDQKEIINNSEEIASQNDDCSENCQDALSQCEKNTNKEEDDLNQENNMGEFAFAPFLCFGVTIALFVGETILNWYISLFL